MSKENFENKRTFKASDFELAQENKKIYDAKFETKPTTFLKDSLKRFAKNKSSIVASFILGIIVLLAIVVPMVSPYDIDTIKKSEQLLAPKLFESGTGFWDGTKKYKDQVYNFIDEVPAGYYKPAVTNCEVDEEPSFIDQASPYGEGGYVNFVHEHDTEGTRFLSSYPATFTATGNYTVDIILFEKEDVSEGKLGEYRVKLTYVDASEAAQEIVLKDWSREYNEFSLDISSALTENGIDEVENASLTFELKNEEEIHNTYILIQSVVFNATDDAAMNDISFTDATKMVLIAKTPEGTPVGYWTCDGRKSLHHSKVYFCNFTYDTYIAAYDAKEVVYAASDLKKLEDQGICKLTYTRGDAENFTFEIFNDEKCPLDGVASIQLNKITGKLLSVTGIAYRYKQYGYDEMPKFIFGTDDSGHDLFTKLFHGLRTSLIMGICTAAFCLVFGLIWGSISGYFGGNVDLLMERFCDVLGNIPSLVVITLFILHIGNNFGAMFLALCMTGWMGTAATTRAQFYRFKGREYVLASRTLGSSDARLIFKHILPNAAGTIITGSVFMVISVIFTESTLSFLGIGLKGVNSFGTIMQGYNQFITTSPNLVICPAVIISLMAISFNLFGNGLRDAVNPSLKGSD